MSNYVYEMEKGWSFDGNYIPHMLELNWLFGEDPFTYDQIQKIRILGVFKVENKLASKQIISTELEWMRFSLLRRFSKLMLNFLRRLKLIKKLDTQ